MNGYFNYKDELMHHGVLGMKWGVRRYQSYSTVPRESGKRGKEIGDANLTRGQQRKIKRIKKKYEKAANNMYKTAQKHIDKLNKKSEKLNEKILKNTPEGVKYTAKYNPAGYIQLVAKSGDPSKDKKLTKLMRKKDRNDYVTSAYQYGYNKAISIVKNMGDAKISVVYDKNNKKSEAYKKAAREFTSQNAALGRSYGDLKTIAARYHNIDNRGIDLKYSIY